MKRIFLGLLAVLPGGAAAQSFDPAVAALRAEWSMDIQVIRRAAELMPESDYAYRPVATVRTFGQILGHLVDSQRSLCAVALGEPAPTGPSIEATVSEKAALLELWRAATTECSRAYLQNLFESGLPRGELSRRYTALVHNTAHNDEHYGNLTTYLRMRGLVPPSSQR